MSQHLSSEQFDAALAGEPTTAATRHLRECAQCEQEVAATRGVLSDLRSQATYVAERHGRLSSRRGRPRVPVIAWALAAAGLFMSAGAPLAVHYYGAAGAGVAVAPGPAAMSDEALLNSVQDDLSSSVPEPLLPLAGASSSPSSSTGSSNLRNKN